MAAKHRVRRVFHIRFGVVTDGGDHGAGIAAGAVPVRREREPALAAGIGGDLARIAADGGHRCAPLQNRAAGRAARHGGRFKCSVHAADIRHGAAEMVRRQLQTERIIRLEQHGFGPHQPLPHGAVGRLPEIAALGVLLMGAAVDERDAQIRHGRAGQHAEMLLFPKVRQDQPLPAARKTVLAAGGFKDQTAAALQGLEQQLHMRIVPERLIVSHALRGRGDRFPVQNRGRTEGDAETEALRDERLNHLALHLAHQAHMQLVPLPVPHEAELRILLLQRTQLLHRVDRIRSVGQQHAVCEHRLEQRAPLAGLHAQTLAGERLCQPRDGAHRAGLGLRYGRKARARVQPDLIRLLLPHRVRIERSAAVREQRFGAQPPAGDLHPCQADAALVGDLEHPRAERIRVLRALGIARERAEQPIDALHAQRGAEQHRKELPREDRIGQLPVGQAAAGEIGLHERFGAHGRAVLYGCRILRKIDAVAVQLRSKPRKNRRLFRSGQIHFVDKQEHGHLKTPQQPPERAGVRLHAVRRADDQHGIVHHLQRALRLRGKVHMAGGVQQRDARAVRLQQRLLGEDGDAARAFDRMGIQKGVAVIHAAEPSERARLI